MSGKRHEPSVGVTPLPCSQDEFFYHTGGRADPRRDCSPAPWSGKKTEPISPPKILFVQQGRQRQVNLRKRSEIMVARGVRRDRQLFRFERSKYALRDPIPKELH